MSNKNGNEIKDKRVLVKGLLKTLEDYFKRDLKKRIHDFWDLNILRHMGVIQRNSVDLPTAYENKEEYSRIKKINTEVTKQFEELTEFFVKNLKVIDPDMHE